MTSSPPRIVSITPLPVDRDTRTLKIATSFARMGYESIVVENRPSRSSLPASLPGVKVITLAGGGQAAHSDAAAGSQEDFPTRIKSRLAPWFVRPIRERAHYCTFLAAYHLFRPVTGLLQVPPADLYYLHEYRLYPMLAALCRRHRAPFIYDAHDFYPGVFDTAELSKFWTQRFLPRLERMERRCIDAADAVVSTSNGMAGLIDAHYGCKTEVIRNCHDPRLERPPTRTLREAAGLGPDDFLIAVTGNRKPGLAVEQATEALQSLPEEVHLAFVGRYHEETPDIAERLGVASRVHAVGAVPPEEVVTFIRSADAALLPYYAATANVEQFLPNGFFQSISAHLPLLFPALPEIRLAVGGEAPGYEINPQEPASISEAVKKMLEDRDAYNEFRRRAETLAGQLSWENEETRLAQLVGTLLN